jgi:hypothetical protein
MAPPTKQEVTTLAKHLNQLAAPTRAPTDESIREQLEALAKVSSMAKTSPSALAPVIPPLVKLLSAHGRENVQHENKDVRLKAAGAISALAKHGDKLAVAVAIPGLLAMLGGGARASLLCMQKMSAGALRSLAENATLKTAISAAGAIPALGTLGPKPTLRDLIGPKGCGTKRDPRDILPVISPEDVQKATQRANEALGGDAEERKQAFTRARAHSYLMEQHDKKARAATTIAVRVCATCDPLT